MKSWWWIAVVIGAVAGWFYWSQWGCTNGWAITGSPVNSTLYGGLMGGLLVNVVRKDRKNEQPTNIN